MNFCWNEQPWSYVSLKVTIVIMFQDTILEHSSNSGHNS